MQCCFTSSNGRFSTVATGGSHLYNYSFMSQGYLSMILHAHLPFVRHPEYEDFLEEDWLYEAITETYIPLINMMDGLLDDGVDFRLTMSLTPPLRATQGLYGSLWCARRPVMR